MARPGLLALAIVIMAEFTSSVSATARHLTSSNPSSSFPLLAVKDANQPNPLLLEWEIPPYDLIKPEHLIPGVQKIIAQLKNELSALEAVAKPDYVSLVRPLEKIYDRIQVFSYLMANYMRFDKVNFADPAGDASDLLDDMEAQLFTSIPIHNAFKAIQASPSFSTLTESQQSVVKFYMEQAKQNGIDLSNADQQKVKDIKRQLDALGDQYSSNAFADYSVMDNIIQKQKAVSVLPTTLTDMAGNLSSITGPLSQNILDKMCFNADSSVSSYVVRDQACDRSLRQELYLANIQKASSGATDNGAVIEQMLTLRLNLAKLLGYNSFAELTLGKKLGMVEGVLENLRKASKDLSTQAINNLKSFVQTKDATAANDLKQWDLSYWKWLKNAADPKYIDEDSVTAYFTLDSLIHEVFAKVNKMFGVTIEPADGQAPVWHNDVRFFAVKDSTGQAVGYLYLDPYYRDGKYSGFWTSEITVHSKSLARPGQSVRLPVYLIATEYTPPTDDTPTLMGFYEIRSLFHEIGHALQGILTRQEEDMVAGFRNLDAGSYEFVSMFMIYWCFQRDTLKAMGKHYQTGAPIPDDVLDKYMATTRRSLIAELQSWVEIASVDLELHSKWTPGESIYDIYQRIESESEFLPPPPEDKSICSIMGQEFSGQYGSVFFDYLLSDVIAADAFSALEAVGLSNASGIKDLGLKFRNTFLSLGGGKPPNDVFADFRGRQPILDVQRMLKLKGMVSTSS